MYITCKQVLSESVAQALQLTGGDEAAEMARFISLVDKFFDSMNVTSLTKGKIKRKVFQNPYRTGKDFRLKVCSATLVARRLQISVCVCVCLCVCVCAYT